MGFRNMVNMKILFSKFRELINFLRQFFNSNRNIRGLKDVEPSRKQTQDEIYFQRITKISNTPSNESINSSDFIEVEYNNKPVWALFKCPCGCQFVITLPLQNSFKPYWTLSESNSCRPTLYPSIWQNKGCFSHFWIEDGIVIWCKNTGSPPTNSSYY